MHILGFLAIKIMGKFSKGIFSTILTIHINDMCAIIKSLACFSDDFIYMIYRFFLSKFIMLANENNIGIIQFFEILFLF